MKGFLEMKRLFCLIATLTTFMPTTSAFSDDETTKLVYPIQAAKTELDNSTPAKRITPPIREESEYDPVTPIGQIRGVLDDLDAVKTQNAAILERLNSVEFGENRELFGMLERGAKEQNAIGTNVADILNASKSIATKIDALQKTTAELRATVESIERTASTVEKIRTSRWTDCAVGAILLLVLIQLVWRAISSISGVVKSRAEKWREMAAAYELAKQQLAAKNKENE